jgi:hypothetical protein
MALLPISRKSKIPVTPVKNCFTSVFYFLWDFYIVNLVGVPQSALGISQEQSACEGIIGGCTENPTRTTCNLQQ